MWMEFRHTFNDSPEAPGTWVSGGTMALEGGEDALAAERFEKALRLIRQETKTAGTRAALAKAWLQLGDCAAAVTEATRAIEMPADDPRYPAPLPTRAAAHAALGNFDAAIADYEAAKSFGADVAAACRGRAAAREAAGDLAGAKANRETAGRLDF